MLIRVEYNNNTFDMVNPAVLDDLIRSRKIRKFLRLGGWAILGVTPVRGTGGSYNGTERRKNPKSAEGKKSVLRIIP